MVVVLTLVGILLVILSLLFMKYYVLTKIRMNRYVKQGFVEYMYSPLFGISKEWTDQSLKDNMITLKTLSLNEKYKNKVGIVSNLKDQPFLIIVEPNLMSQFLQNQQNYNKFQAPIEGFKQFLGNGITFSEGEEWKRKRKFLSNIFKFDIIVNYLGNIREISRKMIDKYDPNQFDSSTFFGNLTGAISISLFMGAEVDNYIENGENPSNTIDKFIGEIYEHYLTLYAITFGKEMIKKNLRKSDQKINTQCAIVRDFMRNILKDSIKKQKQKNQDKGQTSHPNLITLLLGEGHSLENEQEIEELLDISFNLYLAAKDTSTNLLTLVLYYLISHPQYYKRVYEEVSSLHSDYTFNDIQKLDFLAACIKETLRLNTSVPLIFNREAINTHFLGSIKIEKGTIVNIGLTTNQLDSQYFDNPFTYDPDRWFRESTLQTLKEHPYVFIPFSGGMRNCIGQHLAQLQSKIILAEFIRTFEQPQLPQDYQFEMTIKLSYQPKYPLLLKLTKRNQI